MLHTQVVWQGGKQFTFASNARAESLRIDPSIWKDPMVFPPKRFIDGMSDVNINIKAKLFELLLFGARWRVCRQIALGRTLVDIGMIATLLQIFLIGLFQMAHKP